MSATGVSIMVAILGAASVAGVCLPALPAAEGGAGAPAAARGADKGGTRALEACWKAVSVEMYGKEAAGAEAYKKGEWVITPAAISFKLGGQDVRWDYSADGTKTPKTIDLTSTSGPEKGTTFRGIWAVEGDTLRLCYGKDRPKEFVTRPGVEQVLFVFKRGPK